MTPIHVITGDESGLAISARVIDHDNREDRVWLAKHCFWAMRNGHSVTTKPVVTSVPAPVRALKEKNNG